MKTLDLGQIEYNMAVSRQLACVDEVRSGGEDTALVCSHPPVVTVGRGTRDTDIFGWDGPLTESSRGGRATYHGPNQLIAYPIVNLTKSRKKMPAKDLHAYLRMLERVIISCLGNFGVSANSGASVPYREESLTGVWVNDRKIASIGIAVKHWTTYHGISLNLYKDPQAFKGINPCGFSSDIMITLEEVTGAKVSRDVVGQNLLQQLAHELE